MKALALIALLLAALAWLMLECEADAQEAFDTFHEPKNTDDP